VKMIIADDEALVRISLASMIKDMEASWHIVSEATNGEELLAQVAEHKPNIVIADIRMPKLNGLEAIRIGKELSPLTNWVILSGFSDFGYAQQAVKLGVSEYLLKPVDPSELERALQNIYKDNKDYISLLNQQFQFSLFALCHGLTSLKHEERDSLMYQGSFIGWTFHLDTAPSEGRASERQCEFYEEIHKAMEPYLIYGMNLALLALPSGELAAVGAWDAHKGPNGKRQVMAFFQTVAHIVDRFRTGETMVTILQTGECQGFHELNGRLHQLQQWSDLRAVCGIGRNMEYAELRREAESADQLKTARLLCSVVHYVQDWMYLHYHNAINELEMMLTGTNGFHYGQAQDAIRLFLSCTAGLSLPQGLTVRELIAKLRQHGEQQLQGRCRKETNSADLVNQVIQYIEEHYMDDIGIGQIAGQLNVSANYLSALFHKKTGVMFVKYLTRIRMLKAKELLMNTNLQVKQVAEQIGYYSTRHFTKLFTQTFGTYPSDCRNSGVK
jgi:two-component system response regulator YesN